MPAPPPSHPGQWPVFRSFARPAAVFAELSGNPVHVGDAVVATVLHEAGPGGSPMEAWTRLLAHPLLHPGDLPAGTGPMQALGLLARQDRMLWLLQAASGLDDTALALALNVPPASLREWQGHLQRVLHGFAHGEPGQWEAVLQNRIASFPHARLAGIAAQAARGEAASPLPDAASRARWRWPAVFAVLLLCAAALAATWWWRNDPEHPRIRTRPLPAAPAAAAPDLAQRWASHPDREWLQQGDAARAFVNDAAFYAWYAEQARMAEERERELGHLREMQENGFAPEGGGQ